MILSRQTTYHECRLEHTSHLVTGGQKGTLFLGGFPAGTRNQPDEYQEPANGLELVKNLPFFPVGIDTKDRVVEQYGKSRQMEDIVTDFLRYKQGQVSFAPSLTWSEGARFGHLFSNLNFGFLMNQAVGRYDPLAWLGLPPVTEEKSPGPIVSDCFCHGCFVLPFAIVW